MEYFNIIFKDPESSTRVILRTFSIIGLVPLIGLVMVNLGIENMITNKISIENHDYFSDFRTIKDSLNVFAFFSGVLIAISILGTKFQREMIGEQLIGNINEIYPEQFIYYYGVSFSLILALFFLPSLAYLKFAKYRKKIKSIENSHNLSWWSIGRESLEDAKLVLSISLPFLTSILQHFA